MASHGIRILVVDDEKLIRLTLSAKLRKFGYDPVAVDGVDSAVAEFKKNPSSFSAVITDIMMGDMDGFVFRDIIRGFAPTVPIFFLTALDPEEGGGFLKRILEDPISYYLPKAVSTETLLRRVRQVVASHRVERFIQNAMEEDRKSLELAAHIQRSLLPVRAIQTPRGFYATYWRPANVVSGDLIEAVPFGAGSYLYVLGDIQGHGTSAALAMTAVQSFLKNLVRREGMPSMSPDKIANMIQAFFRANLAEVSYMTVLICIHRPLVGVVQWISCGAPDLIVMDGGVDLPVNPEGRGGLPIGLFPDTIYSPADVVETPLSRSAICIACTDGLFDLSRDAAGEECAPVPLLQEMRREVFRTARADGALISTGVRFMNALAEFGYSKFKDDVTLLAFGARTTEPGIYEATFRVLADDIDATAQALAEWCRAEGWPDGGITRVQLVFEEKLMNVHDHGFDDRDRLREVASIRLRRVRDNAVLTVWDTGTEEPSIEVVAGDAATAFEMANQNMSGRGRGRLMVRELCQGVERNRYADMNETIYHIPLDGKAAGAWDNQKTEGGGTK
ncbi:MAG: SpoIIE family protein phosphatase [Kiritimatiellae bacterium]|nr:SpoIIE family protein phosphatase [Kiritimatiellia bacterium]